MRREDRLPRRAVRGFYRRSLTMMRKARGRIQPPAVS